MGKYEILGEFIEFLRDEYNYNYNHLRLELASFVSRKKIEEWENE